MDQEEDEDTVLEEDFYTFLNISKEATQEEINNAYRRLSKMYHPDKHLDPEKKQEAELLFNKTKRAYEMLSDPHRRAIYDSLGVKGVETEGWEIVQRQRTPAEIRAEYEELARDRAERRLQQRTNPHGSIIVNINATDLFNPYDELDYEDLDIGGPIPSVEVSGMSFNQSVEFPLTHKDTCTLGGQLQTHNGTGAGGINLSWRRLLSSKGWMEVDIGAGNGAQFSVKGFRTLSRRFFWNGGTHLQFTSQGIRPGIMSTLAMQIDKNSVGYLTYRGGAQSILSTSIVRDTESAQYNFTVQLGLPHSHISLSYTKKMLKQELKFRVAVKGGTFGGVIEYGAEKKVSKHSHLSAAVSIGVPSGVKLKLKLTRANQIYAFPIHLCEEVMPAPVFYATVLPLVAYMVVKKIIVDPFVREQELRKRDRTRENNKTRMAEKRKEAKAAVDLMQETYARICTTEEAKNGLIIIKAIYGKIISTSELHNGTGDFADRLDDEVIDVTVPVQCLVKDGKLILHERSKSQLPGFFDPAVGEDKQLNIFYKYHNFAHEVTISDLEALRIPKTSHRSNSVT